MSQNTKQSPLVALWEFLCSLRLTIIVLLLLAITSVIGTVIQQGKPAQEYIQEYGETTYRVFKMLSFDDMYQSWWFQALLILFCINLTACSIKRLPHVVKTIKNRNLTPQEGFFKGLGSSDVFELNLKPADASARIASFLGSRFSVPVTTEQDGKIYHFSEKAPWARFGVYVTHLSILVIFVGSIIGNIWGYKAFVNIVEGTSVSKVWSRDGEPIELGFTVRCDEFNVTYYDGSSRPKEFMSILDVIDNGVEVVTDRKIVVNDPITYKGITFYQSSYGTAGNPTYRVRVTPRGEASYEVKVAEGDHVRLANGGSFAITGYAPMYQNFGPAMQMHVDTPDGKHGNPFVVLQNYPEFDAKRGSEFSFALLGYDELQYTGLQVKKDPGVEIVWLGCFFLVFGAMAAFMISHRRLWVVVEPSAKGSLVRMGGSAHRNQSAFGIAFDQMVKDCKAELTK